MKYYMSDFLCMGAAFVPIKKPVVLPSGALLFHGHLLCCGNSLVVSVLAKKGSATRIVGVEMVDSPTGDYVSQKHILRKMYLNAIIKNVGGLRFRILSRISVSVLLLVCMLLMVGCSALGVIGLVLYKKVSFMLLFLVSDLFLYLFWKWRWNIIPYGVMGE